MKQIIHKVKKCESCLTRDKTRIGLHWQLSSKESACNAGDPGSVPGWGRSPGEGNGNPLQYSCLENPMDKGAWGGTVHGVAKSWTRLSDQHTQNIWSRFREGCSKSGKRNEKPRTMGQNGRKTTSLSCVFSSVQSLSCISYLSNLCTVCIHYLF